MSSEEFHHLKVHLKDIASATDNFDRQKLIGHGGFRSVYKGELSLPKGKCMIAFKRLDPKYGQGNDEFWKEVIMLSKYRHENLVSLLCFCDEGHERILGYEFASRGSLDHYLSDVSLTWTQLMCGRLCYKYRDGRINEILVGVWKNHYDENRLDDIVSSDLKKQTDSNSLMTFSAIASRCLNRNRKERPTMLEIVKELEVALAKQKLSQTSRSLVELGRLAKPPLVYESREELLSLLSNGFRHNDTTWLSINKDKRVYETISIIKCITDDEIEDLEVIEDGNSRFDYVIEDAPDFKLKISTQFLIPSVTYNINLVYKFEQSDHGTCVPYKYKLDEEADYSGPFIAQVRKDGWLVTQLYQFTCTQREHHFTIECLTLASVECQILEGIEFCHVEYETEEKKKVNIQSMSNVSNTDWEQKFPIDYIDLIKLSKTTIQWTTKEELYSVLRQGFLIDNGEKKRLMISPRAVLDVDEWILKSSLFLESRSRFDVVAESRGRKSFTVKCKIRSRVLSPQTTYSCHLIYKLPENYSLLQCVVEVNRWNLRDLLRSPWYIYLAPPHTPIIGSNVDGIPSCTRKIEGHPKMRKDGWMECRIWKVSPSIMGTIRMNLLFSKAEEENENETIVDLIVQGIEFRPM
ncbi:Concanavalin A-like lectin/glucanase, subgroup [Cynara cardunculus var. scolymus]|uniref:Concanavalin A-like lectin/glucanase, subgroup n=1 Tax=Cynara cardunculus var. scolymus TaxID=59895 RepID=A0A118JUF8_CYNCS|nr:Concanavalin A-like lectin/glucanase, subgroup [Cynara cardunculus var. scolymus]